MSSLLPKLDIKASSLFFYSDTLQMLPRHIGYD